MAQNKGRPAQVTLVHVASKAGVAVSTASTILSGRPERIALFRDDTVDKVRRAAKSLGYRANPFASSLPTKDSPFFGLVVRDFGRQNLDSWHHWAFEGQFLAGIASYAAEQQLYPIMASIDPMSDDAGISLCERVIAGGVFGAIVRAQNPPLEKFLRDEVKLGRRIVVVFPDLISRWPENAILADNHAIGRTAGRVFARNGARTWGFIRYDFSPLRESHVHRLQGFKEAAAEAGAKVKTIKIPKEFDDAVAAVARRKDKLNLDAIFMADSVLTVNWITACQRAGINMSQSMLLGVNCSKWVEPGLPRVSSIDISWRHVGRLAIEKLRSLSDAGESAFDSLTIAPELIEGETCPLPETIPDR